MGVPKLSFCITSATSPSSPSFSTRIHDFLAQATFPHASTFSRDQHKDPRRPFRKFKLSRRLRHIFAESDTARLLRKPFSAVSHSETLLNTMHFACPFPPLPTELVIRIFELAASTSHTSALSISLVSSWARKIVLPMLFCTIVYQSTPAYSSGMSSGPRSSPHARIPPRHWASLVRNLWVQSSGINNSIVEGQLFHAFYNVEHLALLSSSLHSIADAIQRHNIEYRKCITTGEPPLPAAFSKLRSITLIANTFRYDWHFLLGTALCDGTSLLQNITHLRIHDMRVSAFTPHNMLPNLTHLAVPFLDLGNDFKHDRTLRLPDRILEHPALRMLVLTVAEERWLTSPWYQIARYPGAYGKSEAASPRATFCRLVQRGRQTDERVYFVLAPRMGKNARDEWADASRGGLSLWELATMARADDSYGEDLPDTFPKAMRR